jgi:hypothetical protein
MRCSQSFYIETASHEPFRVLHSKTDGNYNASTDLLTETTRLNPGPSHDGEMVHHRREHLQHCAPRKFFIACVGLLNGFSTSWTITYMKASYAATFELQDRTWATIGAGLCYVTAGDRHYNAMIKDRGYDA